MNREDGGGVSLVLHRREQEGLGWKLGMMQWRKTASVVGRQRNKQTKTKNLSFLKPLST